VVEKPERKRPFERPSYKWKNDIKISFEEVRYKVMKWLVYYSFHIMLTAHISISDQFFACLRTLSQLQIL
jgi:hypothetical protein